MRAILVVVHGGGGAIAVCVAGGFDTAFCAVQTVSRVFFFGDLAGVRTQTDGVFEMVETAAGFKLRLDCGALGVRVFRFTLLCAIWGRRLDSLELVGRALTFH